MTNTLLEGVHLIPEYVAVHVYVNTASFPQAWLTSSGQGPEGANSLCVEGVTSVQANILIVISTCFLEWLHWLWQLRYINYRNWAQSSFYLLSSFVKKFFLYKAYPVALASNLIPSILLGHESGHFIKAASDTLQHCFFHVTLFYWKRETRCVYARDGSSVSFCAFLWWS